VGSGARQQDSIALTLTLRPPSRPTPARVVGGPGRRQRDLHSVAASAEERAALRLDSLHLCAAVRQAWPARRHRLGQHARIARATVWLPRLLRQRPASSLSTRDCCKYLANPVSVDATFGQTASQSPPQWRRSTLDQLQQIYETSTNPEFQENSLRLLAEFDNPALLQRSLDYAVSGKVRNQDAVIQFVIALSIDENREQTWKYIQNNWTSSGPVHHGDGAYLVAPRAASAPPTPAPVWRHSFHTQGRRLR